ncbi:hypothetical protein ACTWP5_14515 [Streptomyces sp. 4N509B]|uniref:hypothetical protein n=1 Tax=Streptomyces sp. 4N509B TaxID=3457413 RepID=UPI003FD5BDE5
MSTIRIPTEELSEAIANLDEISERISETASLGKVGSEDDIGDGRLIDAVNSFDSAWKKGHERVRENVDTFKQAAQGIIDNFTSTDDQLGQELSEEAGT